MSKYKFNDIEVFSTTNAALADLKEKYDTVPDCSTKEGYKQNQESCKFLQKTRKAVDDARTAKTETYREFTANVNGEGKKLIEFIRGLEAPLIKAKKDADEKEAKQKAERIARLQIKVDGIINFVAEAKGKTVDEIQDIIECVKSIDTSIDFYDLTKEASEAQSNTVSELSNMLIERMDYEANEEKRKLAEAATKKANEEKAALEAKAAIESKINNLKMIPTQFFGKSANEIDAKISALANYEVPSDQFLDRTEEAEQAKLQVIAQLGQMLASQKIVEKAAADELEAKAKLEVETVEVSQSGVVLVEDDSGDIKEVDITTPLPIDSNKVDENSKATKDKILGYVDDLVGAFLYYDRKEDEDLPNGAIESAIDNGSISVDDIVEKFKSSLLKAL